MRHAVRALAAFASTAFVVSAGPARSAAPVELEWRAPAGCSSRERVLDEVNRLVATLPREPVRARALVTPEIGRVRVALELEGAAEGVRTLYARSCDAVARATALIIALAIDPQAAALAVEPAVEPTAPAAPSERDTAPDETRAAPARSRDDLAGVAHGGFVAERALVPNLAFGAEAGGGVRWRFVRADLAIGVLPQSSAELSSRPDVRGEFTLLYASLRGCAGLIARDIAALGCGAIRGSRLWARGSGAVQPFEHVAHVLSLEPGVLLRVPSGRGFGTELAASLVVPVERPRFVFAEEQIRTELFRPAVLGVALRLGLGYEF